MERYLLGNGIILYLAEDHSLHVLDAYALFRAGSLYESDDRPGAAQFTASELRSGGTARRLADNRPRLLAREFTRTLYTEAHPLGRPLTPAQVEAIQPEDLQAHYRRVIQPN